jgi:antirestriction protein
MSDNTPRVWVGCLACYNGGTLVGTWFDAPGAPETMADLDAAVWRLPTDHRVDAHEELWVMDHEGFGGLLTGECSPAEANKIAEFISTLEDTDEAALLAAYRANCGAGDLADDLKDMREAYQGEFPTREDFAGSLIDDGLFGEVSESLGFYIDYEKMARDLFSGDYWSADISGTVRVFRNI